MREEVQKILTRIRHYHDQILAAAKEKKSIKMQLKRLKRGVEYHVSASSDVASDTSDLDQLFGDLMQWLAIWTDESTRNLSPEGLNILSQSSHGKIPLKKTSKRLQGVGMSPEKAANIQKSIVKRRKKLLKDVDPLSKSGGKMHKKGFSGETGWMLVVDKENGSKFS
jgi:hypothetical protein